MLKILIFMQEPASNGYLVATVKKLLEELQIEKMPEYFVSGENQKEFLTTRVYHAEAVLRTSHIDFEHASFLAEFILDSEYIYLFTTEDPNDLEKLTNLLAPKISEGFSQAFLSYPIDNPHMTITAYTDKL